MSMENQDKKLLEQCQTGDREAFGKLYDLYVKRIYDFIYYKTRHKETAEDLTSRVFIKALENINKMELKDDTMAPWLYTIARNSVIDHYRAKKVQYNIDDVWDLHSNEDIAQDTDTRLQLEKVKEAMAVLSSRQRDIVIMRLWQGLSYEEIATTMGKSEAACKMDFSRSLNKIRASVPVATFVAFLFFNHFN